MMNETKKIYTMEDNVRNISFGVKYLTKCMEETNRTLLKISDDLKKIPPGSKENDKDFPY